MYGLKKYCRAAGDFAQLTNLRLDISGFVGRKVRGEEEVV